MTIMSNQKKLYWKDKRFYIMNNMQRVKSFWGLPLALLVVSACKSTTNTTTSGKPSDEIIGRWELVEQSNIKNLAQSYPEGLPVLSFEELNNKTMVYGYDGCNQIRTEVKARNNGHIHFDDDKWVSTMMLCENVADETFKADVLSAENYSIDGNYLTVKNDSVSLRFIKIALDGKWTLSKLYNTRPTVAELFPYRKPFLQININSLEFSGHTACNAIHGKVLIHANEMKFAHVASTEMYCDNQGEKLFTDALNQIDRYELSGNKLLLYKGQKLL